MLFDVHAHIWKNAVDQNKRELIRAMDAYAIDRIYVSGLGCPLPGEDEVELLNREVARFIREDPRVRGYAYLNPRHKGAADALKKGIDEQRMSGAKLWVATKCDDPLNFPIYERCIDAGVPVLIHAFHKAVGQMEFESTGVHVAALAQRFPELHIIMAHMGANVYHSVKPVVPYPNVYADISSSIFRCDDLSYTVRALGARRVLFGTDMPGASFNVNLGQVLEAPLTADERDLILYKNALALFRQGGAGG